MFYPKPKYEATPGKVQNIKININSIHKAIVENKIPKLKCVSAYECAYCYNKLRNWENPYWIWK